MKFRMFLLALTSTLGMLAVTVPAQAQTAVPDPLACTGYPQPRIFLQSEAWWEQTSGESGTAYGHVDVGTCFPLGQTLTGKVDFDVRVVLYDEPGELYTVELQLFGKKSGKVIASKSNLNVKCPGEEPCTLWYHLTGDTALYPLDGRQEFRFHALVKQPDGKRTMPSTGWQASLKNGHPKQDYRKSDDFTEGRGWYTDEGYTIARLTTPPPAQPVSGVWNFGVKLAPGSGGRQVDEHYVLVDPCFTCDTESYGHIIEEGSGSFEGKLNIDTRNLANGYHVLLLRSDAPSPTGSTLSGVLAIPFIVRN